MGLAGLLVEVEWALSDRLQRRRSKPVCVRPWWLDVLPITALRESLFEQKGTMKERNRHGNTEAA